MGCKGGWPSHAFNYVKDHAMCTEDQYPYKWTDGKSCPDLSVCTGLDAGVSFGWSGVEPTDMDLLVLLNQQPVQISLDAGDLWHYSEGVYTEACNSEGRTNHAVVAVGYGVDEELGQAYYKMRNSWGFRWGEEGYFRLERGLEGLGALCMLNAPRYPTLRGQTSCDGDGFSQDFVDECADECGCFNPDGSKKNACDYCCKAVREGDGVQCQQKRPSECPFGFSKSYTDDCAEFCGCSAETGLCEQCCKLSADEQRCVMSDPLKQGSEARVRTNSTLRGQRAD